MAEPPLAGLMEPIRDMEVRVMAVAIAVDMVERVAREEAEAEAEAEVEEEDGGAAEAVAEEADRPAMKGRTLSAFWTRPRLRGP